MQIAEDGALTALRVGFVPGVTLTKWRNTWAQRFPRVRLEVIELAQDDQRRALDTNQVDLCFSRLPIDDAGLHVIRLYEEIPVAWVAKDHVIAAVDEVVSADLASENVVTATNKANIELVSEGEAVLWVPQSIARTHSRRDLVYRPITDAPLTTVALTWLAEKDHELIQEFVGIVRGRTANSSRTVSAAPSQRQTKKKPPAKASRPQQTGRGQRRGRR